MSTRELIQVMQCLQKGHDANALEMELDPKFIITRRYENGHLHAAMIDVDLPLESALSFVARI